MARYLTISSELVSFQEIDVYAKESGFVSKLNVDYGSHVKKGQLLAVLEIPELQAQLQEDQAAIKNASDQVTDAEHQLSRVEAQHNVLHLQYDRLNNVSKSKPGLVAQQEELGLFQHANAGGVLHGIEAQVFRGQRGGD